MAEKQRTCVAVRRRLAVAAIPEPVPATSLTSQHNPSNQTFTMKLKTLLMSCTAALCVSAPADRLQERCDAAWAKSMTTQCPMTGVLYGCDPKRATVPSCAKNNLYHKEDVKGWGAPGVGDAPLITGTALAGLCDKWSVTGDEAVKSEAASVARGLLNLAILHGYRGFVARGLCNDGKTTISLSSRDQYTHWVHGLWRYVTSGMADPKLAELYRENIVAVAEFMEQRVTEKNNWNFGVADLSRPDPRGICTMWGPDVWPHEAARLPMIYAAAFIATKDPHWRDCYETYIDPALDRTLELLTLPISKINSRMPCYSLYQANASLELLLAFEQGTPREARIRQALDAFADIARRRGQKANPKKPPYGMCWDGELALARLLAPTLTDAAELGTFLTAAIERTNPNATSLVRNSHVMAAYWKARVRDRQGAGILSPIQGQPTPQP